MEYPPKTPFQMSFHKIIFVLLAACCLSCKKYTVDRHTQQLHDLIDSYQQHEGYDPQAYPLGLFEQAYYEKEAAFASSLQARLSALDTTGLLETDRISYELLHFQLQETIDFYTFERYLNPLLSDAGFHSSLPYMVRPFSDAQQAKQYLRKLQAIPDFVNQHCKNMRAGLAKGVSQPRVIFKGYETTYNEHITEGYAENYFFKPFLKLPGNLSKEQADSILLAGKKAIETVVIPSFKKIKKFFETEYYPQTRTAIGVSSTPNGSAYYQNRINYYTTENYYTADSIHALGLKEVSRIRKEMEKIISELNFKGSFDDFFEFLRTDSQFYADTPEALLMFARDIAKRADEQLPRFFKTLPRKPYGVAAVPEAIAPKYTGGRYVGTSKNSTEPGYYWVNTYDLKSRTLYTIPSLTVHEAVPGHHLQGALNNELGPHIPEFRRNLYLSAYGEGWGLYTEWLADEMGLYTTPYEKFGQLTYEMWRACRLVVDTGIHHKEWSREQAFRFMSSNTALSLHEVHTEIDRYISWPGQALSYKIGELRIRALRKKAEEALGTQFDIREFHEVILSEGTVTLPILESRVMDYIEKAAHE